MPLIHNLKTAMIILILLLLGALYMTDYSQSTAESARDHDSQLQNPDGSWKFTNALIHQTSPYLLQHAHNPVDWHPWGPDAFQLARKQGKPIFLSIGYSTCYWCHVMERQVFENPQLAAMLNKHFVNIKVDREERPDVDDIYMTAVQMMTQHGGWPMSVFLTPPGAQGPDDPGLKPFWAGTYIPPESRHGLPGMPQVIQGLSKAWETQRNQVLTQADQVAHAIRQHLTQQHQHESAQPASQLIQSASNQIAQAYDAKHGGFGGPPKFPQPNNLQFLIKVYQNNPNPELWHALAYTLERMARGGMYDQVGGGFHRYATDEKWLVPHFEKMLYDNAQLVEVYLAAQQTQPDPQDQDLYHRVVRETCDYVLKEMTPPPPLAPEAPLNNSVGPDHDISANVIFFSAQDAEVDAREGLNYIWLPQQIRHAIDDPELAELAIVMYGLDQGTNFQDPHHPQDPPANVLHLSQRLDLLAKQQGMTLPQIVEARKAINRQLLAVRRQRKQPVTDDKTILAWNGMMIAAMAQAGAALGEPRYTAAATAAADTILVHMRQEDGGLYRTMRQGEAKIPAFLEDYAFFVHGLIALHRATNEPRWLETAESVISLAMERFSAQADRRGGYYDTLPDQADLFVRTVSVYDGAIPSGNSQMMHNLIDLYELTDKPAYFDRAVSDLRALQGSLEKFGSGMAHTHHALLRALEISPERFALTDDTAETPPSAAPSAKPRRQVLSIQVEPEVVDLSGGSAQVRVTLQIGEEYHVNAHDPGVEGLIPTAIELQHAPGLRLEVDYPQGHTQRYPFSDQPLHVYQGAVDLVVTLHKTHTPDDAQSDTNATPLSTDAPLAANSQPRLMLRYQLCTDQSCLEPKEVPLPVTIRSGPSSKPGSN